jgi:hypothetical protein
MKPAQLAKELTPYFWTAGTDKIYPKNHWFCAHKGRTFIVKKSSFGWHVDEQLAGDGYKQHALDIIVFDNKTQALQAVIDRA